MNTDLYFYIVNYNINHPIYIVKNTRIVDSDSIEGQEVIKSIDKFNVNSDSIEGQEVIKSIDKFNVARITKVTENKINIWYDNLNFYIEGITENKINILSGNLDFYIEAMTNNLDATKRPATIGIKGKLPALSLNYDFEDWVFEIRNKIQDFAEKIERPIQENQLETIESNLRYIYYKNEVQRRLLRIGKLLIKIFTTVIIALILKYFFEIDLILVGLLISINNVIMLLITDK